MTKEQNKQMVVDFYAALERGDFDTAAAMCHEDFVFYSQVDSPRPGVRGFIEAEKKHLDCFEGFTMKVDTIAEGERVAAYVDFEGPQTQEFYGIAPSGRRLHMTMLNLFTVRDGKFIEKRAHYDRYDHMMQLSADPVSI
ncbi:ester cyclase [Microbacterium sp. LWO13-1.2]|uniref:ester cyclase n=1 Tax=Microbacterium sp. LWO13-1.2 TaxID=3135262 RepID=UPI00313A1617